MTFTEVSQTAAPQKKPLFKRVWFWVVTVLLLALIGCAVWVALLVPSALQAKDALQAAVPLAGQAKDEILSGDSEAATQTVAELIDVTSEAQEATDTKLWRSLEWMPVVGENLRGVRIASAAVQTLAIEVLEPATALNLDLLKPKDGAMDVAAIQALVPMIDTASRATTSIAAELGELDTGVLIGPVKDGVEKLDDAITQLDSMVGPAKTVLQILPAALGADGQRNYLLIFQNNAEIRTTGGNPAAIALITADNGRIDIAQQASSSDFNNNRDTPIIPLNPETQALYGDRVGNWMQDITFTPDFSESTELMRAFWAESFGTPIDAVVSFDPVALSYLLEATGPITLETGDVLTADNAVQLFLNEVYFRYPKNTDQDLFFASATQSIFSAITSGSADTKALVTALSRAVDEGRLLFSSNDAEQMELIGSSPIAGPLPVDNSDATVLGVFFNDLTVGKMDYYLHASVDAESTQCQVGSPATFTATTHMKNVVNAELRDSLPMYIKANAYGFHGAIHTDVMVYGPVGTRVSSVEIDGEVVGIGDRWDGEYREMTHNGRPVLQVPILLRMETEADITVTFEAAEDQPASSFGPFQTRVTPTVHETPVTVSTPGCQ